MPPNLWGPNEPESTVLAEEAWLQGALLEAMTYGALFVLFCQAFYLLARETNKSNYKKKLPYLMIVFLIFMFGTIWTGTNMKSMQKAFIEDRNYPGGPSAFENDTPSNPLASVVYMLSQWLCDGLLVRIIISFLFQEFNALL